MTPTSISINKAKNNAIEIMRIIRGERDLETFFEDKSNREEIELWLAEII
ncbi:MAG: hypothetical protein JGK38_25735 [Microcoleus sp. PH2017_15_JOR_U_A]|nr:MULTISPECIES: hypothetical protein [unclassified Microcoleus]MCC3487811.1 hypothetical protein [Microcoleus sp. PH2017_14_LAR_D_A]MCC3499954.1 hypothetical protein [Microcoleus sp. PH2017_15_JOR_U_A]MCC3581169.1 hypothetical protein [Microcoleus sp. PH2017_32_RDM_D_A]MCC3600514.1 hypothetical protein [Microcoleus sp. PH2017_26_ELK_O_A]MCC3619136.1 hypothetical protein [Microcoleus sp. PH2017_38_RDM_U_B]